MSGPLGQVINRAFSLTRSKNAGFQLPVAGSLPADVVAAVEILYEEQQEFLSEQRGRDEEAAAVQGELRKAAKRG